MNLKLDFKHHGLAPETVLAEMLWRALIDARAWRRHALALVPDLRSDLALAAEHLAQALERRSLLNEEELNLARTLSESLQHLADEAPDDGSGDEVTEAQAEALRQLADDLHEITRRFEHAADLHAAIKASGA